MFSHMLSKTLPATLCYNADLWVEVHFEQYPVKDQDVPVSSCQFTLSHSHRFTILKGYSTISLIHGLTHRDTE